MVDFPLSDEAIKEFTTNSGLHFKLALCEHFGWHRIIPCVLYVTDDKKTYTKFISGGMWVSNNNTQIGVARPDLYFFMMEEKMVFVKWL
jgi:hypothetical protein